MFEISKDSLHMQLFHTTLIFVNLKIDLDDCVLYNNQIKNVNKCFVISVMFSDPPLCEYFLWHGANFLQFNSFRANFPLKYWQNHKFI